ncbi:MAG: hypothetical protein A3G76_03125 [Acidobacteria bacterium RIFCSPLOWO2_12_FULL_65_11]|nr:MAG: hypothetical protein A3H95_10235 [Acidobacteria bacterium RIFCSPLOWO2_02_FULL_64_15]OFW34271.1 MAG: hypothetical protein A3G76_03125 [Acidobacteria bacterium RIFCSPLOWO2_12_FULL_65_11]
MFGPQRDGQSAQPTFQYVARTPTNHVNNSAPPMGDMVKEAEEFIVGRGDLRRGLDRDERAVVVEQERERRHIEQPVEIAAKLLGCRQMPSWAWSRGCGVERLDDVSARQAVLL